MPSKKRESSRGWVAKLAAVTVLILVAAAALFFLDLLFRFPHQEGPGEGRLLKVEIAKGLSPSKFGQLLWDKGLIERPWQFGLWLRVSKKYVGVKAGEFWLADNMAPSEILGIVSQKGVGKGIKVTIPEGFKLVDIAQLLEQKGLVSQDSFLAAAQGPLLKKYEIPADSFEGYLFPETYYFEPGVSSAEIISKLYGQFLTLWKSLEKTSNTKRHKIVTLASIIQAEAVIEAEMPVIAGVYTNRQNIDLFPSGLLQADPTVAYGCSAITGKRPVSCDTFKGKLGSKQLRDRTNRYNTYVHKGLPQGPICAPGRAAIVAALHPKKIPYLYFVAGPGGRHRFATTLKEHNQNVTLYRQGR